MAAKSALGSKSGNLQHFHFQNNIRRRGAYCELLAGLQGGGQSWVCTQAVAEGDGPEAGLGPEGHHRGLHQASTRLCRLKYHEVEI